MGLRKLDIGVGGSNMSHSLCPSVANNKAQTPPGEYANEVLADSGRGDACGRYEYRRGPGATGRRTGRQRDAERRGHYYRHAASGSHASGVLGTDRCDRRTEPGGSAFVQHAGYVVESGSLVHRGAELHIGCLELRPLALVTRPARG